MNRIKKVILSLFTAIALVLPQAQMTVMANTTVELPVTILFPATSSEPVSTETVKVSTNATVNSDGKLEIAAKDLQDIFALLTKDYISKKTGYSDYVANSYQVYFTKDINTVTPDSSLMTVVTHATTSIAIPKSSNNDYTFYVQAVTKDELNTIAQQVDPSYEVTFDLDGGTLNGSPTIDSQTVYKGETVNTDSLTGTPVKDGYTFAGWSPALETPVTAATVFKAQWTQSVTVTFDVDGVTTTQTGTPGAALTKPADPTKTGYTFAGWDPAVPDTFPSANTTYTAQWSINSFTITYKDGDTVLATKTANYGDATPTITSPTKAGYVFTGWSPSLAATVTADAVYTAQWHKNTYTITYKDGNNVLATYSAAYGDATPKPSNPTKNGYTFQGWNPSISSKVTGNATYIATWKANSSSSGSGSSSSSSSNSSPSSSNAADAQDRGHLYYQGNGVYSSTQSSTSGSAAAKNTTSKSTDDSKTSTDKVKITIEYLDQDTNKSIRKSVSIEVAKGMSYNVQSYGKATIDGYTYVKTDGSLTGTAEKDITIKVYYSAGTENKTENSSTLSKEGSESASSLTIGLVVALGVGLLIILLLLLFNRKRQH